MKLKGHIRKMIKGITKNIYIWGILGGIILLLIK